MPSEVLGLVEIVGIGVFKMHPEKRETPFPHHWVSMSFSLNNLHSDVFARLGS